MLRRTTLSLTIALVALLFAPALASAATPSQIFKDAEDGSIDGDYSLADLRAADASIPADQREYFLWDEIYSAAVSRIANPNAPKPPKLTIVKPVDTNKNGKLDQAEVKAAATKTKAINKKKLATLDKIVEENPEAAAEEVEASQVADSVKDDDGSEDSSVTLIVILALLLLAPLVAMGVRALLRRRGSGGPKGPKGPKPPKGPKGGPTGIGGGSSYAAKDAATNTKRAPKKRK